MLQINVTLSEVFNQVTQKYVRSTFVLELEHSLATLSKWESFFKKPFLSPEPKTIEETFWYVKAMASTPDVPPEVFEHLSEGNVRDIHDYIAADFTATWFSEVGGNKIHHEIITAEILYYLMVTHGIPFETQHWHLSRLVTLIRVCNEKNAPKKELSPAEQRQSMQEENARRRVLYGTTG